MLSAGLFLGLTREAATRYSFVLVIPTIALSVPGLFELASAPHPYQGNAAGPQMLVGTLIAFAIAYASIAWLLRYVVHHTMYVFVGYRILLGGLVLSLLAAEIVSAS
jgi:undecaprenyl-diphosphatase